MHLNILNFIRSIVLIILLGNLALALNGILLLQKRAFHLIANINHIPYHLIQTSDLHTSLNLVPIPQLARKFMCSFGYHAFFTCTCPDFFVEDFLLTHRPIHPETNIFYNTTTIPYATKLLHHLMHSSIKHNPL